MTRKIVTLATVALLVFGCSRSGKIQRGQQQYDVVQEGSATGVTSTINGPGETPAPATDTNADPTTNFTLPNPNPLGNDTAGSTMDGSQPPASPPSRPRIEMPKKIRTVPPTETTDTTTMATDTETTTTTTPSDTKKRNGASKGDQSQPPPPPPPADATGTQG